MSDLCTDRQTEKYPTLSIYLHKQRVFPSSLPFSISTPLLFATKKTSKKSNQIKSDWWMSIIYPWLVRNVHKTRQELLKEIFSFFTKPSFAESQRTHLLYVISIVYGYHSALGDNGNTSRPHIPLAPETRCIQLCLSLTTRYVRGLNSRGSSGKKCAWPLAKSSPISQESVM